MNPFYFGSSKSPLYGVYHPPRADAGTPRAVLACYPMGAEYMRAHRAFRQLTTLLVKGGAHVLRFDYFGTGDSAGEGTEASLARWREDIGVAVEELKEMSQARAVTVVGLRLGAALAAQAGGGRPDVEQAVLWDPVLRGAPYVEEMLAIHRAEQAARGRPGDGATAGVHGFPLTPTLRAELAALDLTTWDGGSLARVDLVTSAASAEAEALAAALRARGTRAQALVCPSKGNWDESDAFGSALIPQSIIQGVVGCILGTEARAA